MKVRVRLAPSPTGNLHIGTARTALFNWLFAKSLEGEFLLRVEDTDKERSKKEYLENIFLGLEWLGLKWDGSPFIQSERIKEHKDAISYLLEAGLAYRCYATEEELEEMRASQKRNAKPPRYDNRGRSLSKTELEQYLKEGRSSVIRFRINDEEIIKWNDLIRGPMEWSGKDLGGDMVIARRAESSEIGDPLYNLVVVVDDSQMQISHVIRGEDHIANTAKQILLYDALGIKIPIFAHSPLILNHEGKKLSKRDGVTSITDFKKMGYTSEAMNNYMALLGWSPPDGMDERFNIKDAIKKFSFNRVSKSGAKFDWEKLNWINSQVINQWDKTKLLTSLLELWDTQGWKIQNKEWGLELTKLIAPSLVLLKDALDQGKPFFEDPILNSDAIKQLEMEDAKNSLKMILNELENNPWDGKNRERANEIIKLTMESLKVKKGLIMKSLRASLLGELQGPDLITTWSLLAQINKDQSRIRNSIK